MLRASKNKNSRKAQDRTMAKDELSLKEKEVIQSRLADSEFFDALDHLLSIEGDSWRQKMMNAAKAGAESSEPIQRLLIINEAAAKATVFELFFVVLNQRTGAKALE